MSECCCHASGGAQAAAVDDTPCAWFGRMIQNCLSYARAARAEGRPIVGILCEFTPRELIMAAGGVPVCLCAGSAATIPPAERDLPANLCPLIKSTYGYHLERSNPFLEMADLIVAETTCDGKKKMYELLAESRPMYVLELPQKADDAEAFEHWLGELHKFRDFLARRWDVEICEPRLRDATRVMNRERALRRQLAAAMKADCPPLTGLQLSAFRSSISGIPDDLAQYERAIAMLAGAPPRPELASRARVLVTGVPMVTGQERVLEIVEQCGGLVVCMENCGGLKPILEDVDADAPDPLRALADKYYHLPCSVLTRNDRRLDTLRQLAAEYRAECVIDLVWQACLTYDVESARVRRMVEGELGLPYLRIETDYSPSDSARIAVRVEALFETVAGGRRTAVS
ncbi:MAG: double-cubane-cluster-containing anaerobic reductase [Planctomycetota bacterium]